MTSYGPRASRAPHERARGSRSGRLRFRMPGLVVVAMDLREAVAEVGVVVFLLEVMDLQPDARRMDRLDVGREAAVRLVDVGADVARAVDHVLGIDARLLEIGRAERAAVELREGRGVAVGAVGDGPGGGD